jgi:hypothetical protein
MFGQLGFCILETGSGDRRVRERKLGAKLRNRHVDKFLVAEPSGEFGLNRERSLAILFDGLFSRGWHFTVGKVASSEWWSLRAKWSLEVL